MSTDEFQTWALNHGYIDFRQVDGRYVNQTTHDMWVGWQASRAELVIELPTAYTAQEMDFRRDVAIELEAAGIRTK